MSSRSWTCAGSTESCGRRSCSMDGTSTIRMRWFVSASPTSAWGDRATWMAPTSTTSGRPTGLLPRSKPSKPRVSTFSSARSASARGRVSEGSMQLAFVPPAASPIRRQYLTLKRQHPDAILFFQLGDFYETFEDDARLVAEVCEIALTAREMGKGERVPMAGVPVHAAELYLGRLVERGYHIAICQQMEEPSAAARVGSSVVRREVTRVITPGTLVDPSLLSAERANYLAALVVGGKATGLACADIR